MTHPILVAGERQPRPLRAWQAAALPLALQSLAEQRAGTGGTGVIAACTGAGKSRLIAEVIAAELGHLKPREVVVLTTPTVRLVQQLTDTLDHHPGIGVVQPHYTHGKWSRRSTARVIVCCNASAPSLAGLLDDAGVQVGLWIADEAHRTETPEIHTWHQATTPRTALAVTATPFRADTRESLRLWERELYRYSPAQALADGVLVPWRAVPWDGDEVALDDACLTMISALGAAGPGVVNALSCDDAESFAAKLSRRQIPAAAVHSRMHHTEQTRRLEALRDGALSVVVYPSLLCEGVDFPWLRWGCLRRPVSSRVRFIQELGRFLRVHPGKTEAIILDPLGQLEDHAVSVEAALGWIDDPEPSTDPAAPVDEIADDEIPADTPPTLLLARTSDRLAAYTRSLLLGAIAAGHISPDLAPDSRPWRKRPASQKQAAFLGRLLSADRHLCPSHRAPLRRVVSGDLLPSCGAASDLISLLSALRDGGESYTPPSSLLPLSIEAIDAAAAALDELPVYVAAAQSGGWMALAVCRHGLTLASTARKLRGPNVLPLAAEITALAYGARTLARRGYRSGVLLASAEALEMLQRTPSPLTVGALGTALARWHGGPEAAVRLRQPHTPNPAQDAAWATLERARKDSA